MGTTRMKIFGTMMCLFVCMCLSAQENVKDMVGNWSFSAPNAPYGYQDGSCQFKEKDGKLSAVAKVNGSEVIINEIASEDDSYKCSFNLDGYGVQLTLKADNKKQLSGTAYTQGSSIPVTLKKAVGNRSSKKK